MGSQEDEALKSLPLLQDRIKKDAEAYKDEFSLQFEHFRSALDLFTASPQKPDKSFHELVMFIAHAAPSYRPYVEPFVTHLKSALETNSELIHPLTRRTLVNGILLLRGRQAIKLTQVLGLLFDMLDIPDKALRRLLLGFIVKDIARNKLPWGPERHELHQFLLSRMGGKSEDQQKRAMKIAIDLYRRGAWADARLVNAIAEGCFSSHPKVALIASHFLLGNFTPLLEDDDENSSDDDAGRGPIGSKKTRGTARKLEREKDVQKRKQERRHNHEAALLNFSGGAILDLLRDPQQFADRLLARISSSRRQKDPFALRLSLLNVVSRLIGRFQLLVLGFYPLIQRFLNPKQKQITAILAIVAQACHELVPPDDLQPVIKCLLDHFVAEYQAPEVIAVGLNAIREICVRTPLALTAETLADLAEFRKYRHKIVVAGARSIVNLYRDVYPELLHRRLRGRTAAIEVSEDRAPRPLYGQLNAETGIRGLNALSRRHGDDTDDDDDQFSTDEEDDASDDGSQIGTEDGEEEDGSDNGDEGSTGSWETLDSNEATSCDGSEQEDDEATVSMASSPRKRKRSVIDPTMEILTNEDFRRLKKLRQTNAASDDDDESLTASSDTSDEESNEEEPGVVRPEQLASGVRKKGRDHRMAAMNREKETRVTFTERMRDKSRSLKASIPESVKRRNKPLLMVKQNRGIREKKHNDVATRVANLRKHVKTLKKQSGKRTKYRRM